MNKVQEQIYDVFKEFDRVCKLIDAEYSLAYGTLLGSIRHKGFIPWDDDIDVIMDRETYDRFMIEAPKHLNPKYFLQNNDTDPYYYFPFAKIRNDEVEMREKATAHLPINHGVWIDIFPYDKVPEDPSLQRQQYLDVMHFSNRINFFNFMYVSGHEKLPVRIIKRIIVFFNKKFYKLNFMTRHWYCQREKSMRRYNNTESKIYGMQAFRHKKYENFLNSFIYENEMYDLTENEFEDGIYPIYKEYDAILTRNYGDYMEFPPESERKSVHTFED